MRMDLEYSHRDPPAENFDRDAVAQLLTTGHKRQEYFDVLEARFQRDHSEGQPLHRHPQDGADEEAQGRRRRDGCGKEAPQALSTCTEVPKALNSHSSGL